AAATSPSAVRRSWSSARSRRPRAASPPEGAPWGLRRAPLVQPIALEQGGLLFGLVGDGHHLVLAGERDPEIASHLLSLLAGDLGGVLDVVLLEEVARDPRVEDP